MIIVYESKTGFTKRYAEMLAEKTGFRLVSTAQLVRGDIAEDVIFLGWMKVGKIQGLKKLKEYCVKAVCGSGTGRTAEPSEEGVIASNQIEGIPFFYLRGGCKPLKELKGLDKLALSFFVRMLKKNPQDEKTAEAISNIENGFDGVKEENLEPVLAWLKSR